MMDCFVNIDISPLLDRKISSPYVNNRTTPENGATKIPRYNGLSEKLKK